MIAPAGLTFEEASGLCSSVFDEAIDFLRPGLSYAPHGPLRQAANTISRLAGSPWRLDLSRPAGFHLDPVQAVLSISPAELGGMASAIISRCERDSDVQVRQAVAAIAAATPIRAFLSAALLELFLAHEFIHVAQRLGSFEYEDSDGYSRAVALIDYQADVSSMFYVFSRHRLELAGLPGRDLLLVLMIIHVAAMQYFAPVDDDRMQRASFERIMIWHWQAARVAAGPLEPDPTHPSLLNMPVVCLPETDGISMHVARPDPATPRNETSVSRQDVVLAFHHSDSSAKMTRLRSTSADRVAEMVRAVFDGNFAAFRSCAGEVFSSNAELLDLAPPMAKRSAARLLKEAIDLSAGLQEREALSWGDPQVFEFFDRAALLLQMGIAATFAWEGSELLASGRTRQFIEDGSRSGQQSHEATLRSEINRVSCRLGLLADEFLPS